MTPTRIVELYRGLFPSRRGLVVMLRAYLDASGVPRPDRYLAVAGFLSTPQQWDRAEREWRRSLVRAGVENFHIADVRSKLAAPYRDWPERKCAAVETKLLRLIADTAKMGTAVGVSLSDYELVDREHKDRLGGNSYALCAMRAIYQIAKWIDQNGPDDEVAYIFETGDVGHPRFIKAMTELSCASDKFKRKYRIHSVTGLSKQQVKILDMADLLAWEITHHIPKELEMTSAPMSDVLTRITGAVDLRARYFDRTDLTKMANRNTPQYLIDMQAEFGLSNHRRKK